MSSSTPLFKEGERVRHKFANLAGRVERDQKPADYVKVAWDHYGLAVAALGSLADLQLADALEREG